MIQIKHRNNMRKISQTHPAYATLDQLCTNLIDNYPEYSPDFDGWLVLLEAETGDFTRPLTEIWPDGTAEDSTLHALQYYWEGVTLEDDGYFHIVYLANNQFGLYVLLPDCPELPEDVKASLEYHNTTDQFS